MAEDVVQSFFLWDKISLPFFRRIKNIRFHFILEIFGYFRLLSLEITGSITKNRDKKI